MRFHALESLARDLTEVDLVLSADALALLP